MKAEEGIQETEGGGETRDPGDMRVAGGRRDIGVHKGTGTMRPLELMALGIMLGVMKRVGLEKAHGNRKVLRGVQMNHGAMRKDGP